MIVARAPVRVCDIGGWTDTWFGGPGRIVNLAVTPGVEVTVERAEGPDPVVVDVEAFGDRYPIAPGEARVARHALVEAAIDALPPPADIAVEVRVRSSVPPGCGTGTSAAVAVALLGALAAARGELLSPRLAADAAHRLEVDALGGECGVQDQLSAAFGGISYLEIDPYPAATVRSLPPWDALGDRLSLVFLGRPHDSSEVHRQVIADLGRHTADALPRLRAAAVAARDAVLARDLAAFGQAMVANHGAQRALHEELVGTDARRVIELAATSAALGWKVNGAGGDGGSVTILHATRDGKTAFDAAVPQLDGRYQPIPVELTPTGLQVTGAL